MKKLPMTIPFFVKNRLGCLFTDPVFPDSDENKQWAVMGPSVPKAALVFCVGVVKGRNLVGGESDAKWWLLRSA